MKPNTSRPEPEVLNVDFSSKNVFRSRNLLTNRTKDIFFFPGSSRSPRSDPYRTLAQKRRFGHRECENRRANMEHHGGCVWGAPGLSGVLLSASGLSSCSLVSSDGFWLLLGRS